MAHSFKVEVVPGKNKDGSTSKTKKIYRLIDRHRGKRTLLAEVTSKKELAEATESARSWIVLTHLGNHRNDMAFRRKHNLL